MPYDDTDNSVARHSVSQRTTQPLSGADADVAFEDDPESLSWSWPELPPDPTPEPVEGRGGESATSAHRTSDNSDSSSSAAADTEGEEYPGWQEFLERQRAESEALYGERMREEAALEARRERYRARQRPEMEYDSREAIEERRHYVERLWLQRTSVRDIARALSAMKGPDGAPRFHRCTPSTVQQDINWIRKNHLIASVSQGTLAERRAESIRTHELVQHEAWLLTQKVAPNSQNASAALQLVMTAQERLDRIYGVGAPESLTSAAVVEIHQAAEQTVALIAEQLGVPADEVLRVFNQLLAVRAGGTSVGPLLNAPDTVDADLTDVDTETVEEAEPAAEDAGERADDPGDPETILDDDADETTAADEAAEETSEESADA